MNEFDQLEKRTETEAVALLENDICPICLHPVECVGGRGGSDSGDEWDYDCEGCGHSFTLFTDRFGIKTLDFGV